ncbi:hypothetical protein Anapl_01488 [Anas platyrhynchos]|uniref:Uncharacterized protein n=1 Tax=Anas platyrhynchos TaxID=8839 RepID=R0KE17_ANAPL|nr:hypothetical protein Anapl_01488 [Anas platyrhynchos]
MGTRGVGDAATAQAAGAQDVLLISQCRICQQHRSQTFCLSNHNKQEKGERAQEMPSKGSRCLTVRWDLHCLQLAARLNKAQAVSPHLLIKTSLMLLNDCFPPLIAISCQPACFLTRSSPSTCIWLDDLLKGRAAKAVSLKPADKKQKGKREARTEVPFWSLRAQAISRKVRGCALTAASMAKARDMCSTRRDGVSDVWSLLESKPQSYKCETLIGKE